MSDEICRWGILGTATIARKNWQAIRNASNCTLMAVASRTLARAEKFIDECQSQIPFAKPPRPVGDYDELLSRTNIDAVYIPLPTGIRKEWVIRAAEAGKHVLCEKPCAANADDLAEMIEACKQNNVQFMDGVMFMHSHRLVRLRKILGEEQNVGTIKRIATQFSFCAPDDWVQSNIRTSSELEPLGCLGDLGWYTIRFILWTLDFQMPRSVSARMLTEAGRSDSPSPVPMELSAEMFFEGGVSASMYCSFVTENQQWANISGTKGFVYIPDFVLPYFGDEVGFQVTNSEFNTVGCNFNMEERTRRFRVNEYSNSSINAQETFLFRNFAGEVLAHSVDPYWPEIALKTQEVMDACLESARSDGKLIELEA
jgi:predicted dehydrogenase